MPNMGEISCGKHLSVDGIMENYGRGVIKAETMEFIHLINSATVFVGEAITANSVDNSGEIIPTGKKLVIRVKNLNGFENIKLDTLEELVCIDIKTPINLAHLDQASKLAHLTLENCCGIISSEENFEACKRLTDKGITLKLIGIQEFQADYAAYCSPGTTQKDLTQALAASAPAETLAQCTDNSSKVNATGESLPSYSYHDSSPA